MVPSAANVFYWRADYFFRSNPMPAGLERRRKPRDKAAPPRDTSVVTPGSAGAAPIRCKIVDASDAGLLVRMPAAIAAGVNVKLTGLVRGEQRQNASGRVVRCAKDPAGGYRV